MTNNLSKETVAYTLRMGQALIGKTRSEILQTQGDGSIRTFCGVTKHSSKEASILFSDSQGVSFGCYFPFDRGCVLVNVTLPEKEVEQYLNYCHSQYKPYKTVFDSWCCSELNLFIRIFFDTEENSYILSVMEMNDSDCHGVN